MSIEPLGLSVYLSTFEQQRATLEKLRGEAVPIFLSLHISEEFGEEYRQKAETACRWLTENGFRIIADVSPKAAVHLGEQDMARLAERLGIWALRLDYGFSTEEMCRLAKKLPLVLNASTVSDEVVCRVLQCNRHVMAMHNFYPRPETGLDRGYLMSRTKALQALGLRVLAFVPGDTAFRGPLHLGLPTLEEHRGLPPSVGYADLMVRCGMDGVFAADPGVSRAEIERIGRYCRQGVWELPAGLLPECSSLYGQVFTSRPDSPDRLIRFAESREYSCFGSDVAPLPPAPRKRGAVTMDNSSYGRYSGEIQLMRNDLPPDPRVNVIGHLAPGYELLADCILPGEKFALVPQG